MTRSAEWRCFHCDGDIFVRAVEQVIEQQDASQSTARFQPPTNQHNVPQMQQPRVEQPPDTSWPPNALSAYEIQSYRAAGNRIVAMAQRLQAGALTEVSNARWSDVLVPWIWLAAHEMASDRFAEPLAGWARGARDQLTGMDCTLYIIHLWRDTQFGFRAMGIRSAVGLIIWLQEHRQHMREWMAADSRYRHLCIKQGPWLRCLGRT